MTLVGLSNDTARLAIGNRDYTFPLSEIDEVWGGAFILLWKPPFASRWISPGDRGEDVLWVRRALDKLEGRDPDPADSDLYDEKLRKRILSFQRKRSLIQNGVVQAETLVQLALAFGEPNAPSLKQHGSKEK